MENTNFSYAEFKDKQERLGALIRESSECLKELSMVKYAENLTQLANKVSDDSFKIMVVGTFKNGKSTFINSLLGKDVLPAYAVPCTAVINEVKYGKESAVLYFRNPLPKKLPSELPPAVENHINRNGKVNLPPITIPYKEIEDYVCIPMNKDFNEIALESPYEKLELFWPSNLLENGVEIIDSPGLNEHETRTKVTSEYLTKADAILFVLNAQAICSQEEMKFIENSLNSYGFTNPFFIVNRFDAIREREKQRMIDFTHSKLDQYTKQKIYFISALDALDGKEDNDEALLEKSGVPALEKDLADFLTNERGKAKLKQPLNELSYVLQKEAFNKYIPDQRRLLDKDVNQLKKRLEKEKPKLDILREKKNQLSKTMKSRISSASKQLAFLVRGNTKSLGSKVSAWVNECNIDNDIGAFSNEADRKKAAEKILSYVSQKIEKEQREWNNDVLRPEIEKSTKEIFESAESRISEIYSVIDSINIGLTGGNPDTEAVPTWERVAGAVGGLMFGDISTAISGGINGLSKEFFKTFAMNFGLAIGLSMFGILNIFTAVPILAGLIAYNVITGGNKVREQVKKGVSEEIVKQISQQSNEVAENMQKQFEYKFNKQADQIADALDIEINSVEQKVNDIITEKEKGEEAVSKKKALLDRCEKKILATLNSLKEFNDFVAA